MLHKCKIRRGDTNIKVLQVLPTLSAGGAVGFVSNLGVSLTKLRVEVKFFLLAGVRGDRGQVLLERLRTAGIEVIGTEEHKIRSPKNLIRLVRLIRSWRPDIVQANLYSAEVFVAAAKALSIGSGTCYVRRLANTQQSGHRSTRVVRMMMDRVYRQTIACAPAVAEAYQGFMGMNHNSELVTISNGGFLQEGVTTTEEKRQAREKLAIPDLAFVVAHIGRMFGGGLETSHKAHDVLIRAFAKAFAGDSQCILVMVGDGPLRPGVEALAKKIGIAVQTRFLGQQPEPWPALKAADMFCFPSRYEGLPNVLPEAASCGLPIVASDIPQIRSLCPGDAWLLKPVDNVEAFAYGVRKVLSQHSTYKQLADTIAPQIRERLSMFACARRYFDAYKSALNT